jgi:hypothetical protein
LASVSMACTATVRGRWLFLAAGTLLSVVTIAVRTAGIVFVPVLLFALFYMCSGRIRSMLKGRNTGLRAYLSVGAVLAGLAVLVASVSQKYMAIAVVEYSQAGLFNAMVNTVWGRLIEAGSIAMNIPTSKLPSSLTPVLTVIGAIVIAALSYSVVKYYKAAPVVTVFVAIYGALLVVAPWHDERYWLPLMPALVIYLGIAVKDWLRSRAAKAVLLGVLAWFVVFGFAAMGYTLRITWAGTRFPELYGDGNLALTYAVAYGQLEAKDVPATQFNLQAFWLMRRFDPRTR